MRRTLIITALLGLSLFGSAAPASAWNAVTADVTSATVVARGAALDVTTTVVCPDGTTGQLYLSLTQRSGNDVAQGGGYTSAICTGEPQTVTLRVVAQPGAAVFRPGEAIVTGDLYACDDVRCIEVPFSDTVRVTRN